MNQVGRALAYGYPVEFIQVDIGSIVAAFGSFVGVFFLTATLLGSVFPWVSQHVHGDAGWLVSTVFFTLVLTLPLVFIYDGPGEWLEWIAVPGATLGPALLALLVVVVSMVVEHFRGPRSAARGSRLRRYKPLDAIDVVERTAGPLAAVLLIVALLLAGYSYSLGRAHALNETHYLVIPGHPARPILAIYGNTVISAPLTSGGVIGDTFVVSELGPGQALTGERKTIGPVLQGCQPFSGCH